MGAAERSALGRQAADVLRANDRGDMTVAAPALYPHQWSWDAAFVAIGLAHLSVPRACVELDHLLRGQWATGMIPHIVYDPDATGYFPDAARWGCADLSPAAPAIPATSGIAQPPVHAIALARIAACAPDSERDDVAAFLRATWPRLLAWHRWLAGPRRSPTTGLVRIVHGWESGMDNSPRFDAPYDAVVVGTSLPPYRRADTAHVADDSERPTDRDYDRYLWLIEELRAARYGDEAVVANSSFLVGDVFITALLALACETLADLAPALGVVRCGNRNELRRDSDQTDVEWLRATADELRTAVAATIEQSTGLATDIDERSGSRIRATTDTIAGFAPLLCGFLDESAERRMIDAFTGRAWCGNPDLFAPVPPSTTPLADVFEPRRYWRGPVWPVLVWLFGWALERRGHGDLADQLRDGGLALVADGTASEYYDPLTGASLGSASQSWTAAVTLDWLA